MTDGPPKTADRVSKKAVKKKKAKKSKVKESEDIVKPDPIKVAPEVVSDPVKSKKKRKKKRAELASSEKSDGEEATQKLVTVKKNGEKKHKKRKKEERLSVATEAKTNHVEQEKAAEPETVLPQKQKKAERTKDGSTSAKKKKKAKKQEQQKETTAPDLERQQTSPSLKEAVVELEPVKAEQMPERLETAEAPEEPAGQLEQPASTEKTGPSLKRPFRRVADEKWLGKKGAWDNSYEATFGNTGWGAKAQQVLATVRGKNFRHEKTKKKRGTYFGGKISVDAIRSIKFESDED